MRGVRDMPKDWRENAITATVLGAELWSPGTRRLPNGGVANVFNLPINLIGNNANQVNLFPISSPYFWVIRRKLRQGLEDLLQFSRTEWAESPLPEGPTAKRRLLALPETLPCARAIRAHTGRYLIGEDGERLRLRAAASICAAGAGFRTATGKCPKIPAGPPRARRS